MQAVRQEIGAAEICAWVGGEGAPLVYLHGFEQHPGGAGFLARLAEKRKVLAPEHPGFGGSGGFAAIEDMLDLVFHYRDYIEANADGPVDLVGHSLGGMFAAEIAATFPELVRRLVLVDAYGLWLDEHPMPDPFVIPPKALAAAKWADPERWASAEPNGYDGRPEAYIYYRSQNLGAASKFMWPIPDRGLAKRIRRVRAETLVIHGAEDGLVPPAYAEAFAKAAPNARVVMIPKAGHLPMIEAEDAFLAALDDFLG